MGDRDGTECRNAGKDESIRSQAQLLKKSDDGLIARLELKEEVAPQPRKTEAWYLEYDDTGVRSERGNQLRIVLQNHRKIGCKNDARTVTAHGIANLRITE